MKGDTQALTARQHHFLLAAKLCIMISLLFTTIAVTTASWSLQKGFITLTNNDRIERGLFIGCYNVGYGRKCSDTTLYDTCSKDADPPTCRNWKAVRGLIILFFFCGGASTVLLTLSRRRKNLMLAGANNYFIVVAALLSTICVCLWSGMQHNFNDAVVYPQASFQFGYSYGLAAAATALTWCSFIFNLIATN